MRGGQWAVQLQFKRYTDSKLNCNLPITAGMDCNLASLEHLHIVYRVSFHLQGTLKKDKLCGGIPVIVVCCMGMQYILRTNLVLQLFQRFSPY